MIRSQQQNKENHVAFKMPPKTPTQSTTSSSSGKPTMPAKTPSLFVTPSRKPLGGKDGNTRLGTAMQSKMLNVTTQKPASTRRASPLRRTPLSGKLQAAQTGNNNKIETQQAAEPVVDETWYGDMEVESIPEKPPVLLRDLPLDHVEMDYNAIRVACLDHKKNSAVSNSRVDQNVNELLDQELPNSTTAPAPRQLHRTPSSLSSSSSSSLHSQPRPQSRRHDFMAPTKSNQAKQHMRQPSAIQVARDVPPQVKVHVDASELESLLF